jgi:uridine phosphorylase
MYPLLEFDSSPTAVIEPSRIIQPLATMPERCVLCFFQDAIQQVCVDASCVTYLGSEIGQNPVYVREVDGQRIAVVHPGVGAPLAVTALEELIALGCKTFIACGGAGVLDREITVGHVIIPLAAVRDEGTSYHYLPPGREVAPTPRAVEAILSTLTAHEIPYVTGKTWTTDALYRETAGRVAARRAEGCLTVEMEASAFFAVAQFRGITFGQLLYGGDDVSSHDWDSRGWLDQRSTREKLLLLALEAAARL